VSGQIDAWDGEREEGGEGRGDRRGGRWGREGGGEGEGERGDTVRVHEGVAKAHACVCWLLKLLMLLLYCSGLTLLLPVLWLTELLMLSGFADTWPCLPHCCCFYTTDCCYSPTAGQRQ